MLLQRKNDSARPAPLAHRIALPPCYSAGSFRCGQEVGRDQQRFERALNARVEINRLAEASAAGPTLS